MAAVEKAQLEKLVHGVRRREILQLVATQAVVALTLATGGLSLLLLLGTQVLDWYWPLLLGAGSFGYLVWKIRTRLPSPYVAAQRIDARLGLADLMSSAWHFAEHTGKARTSELVALADEQAARINLDAAAPWKGPKGWGRAAAVSAMALSLLVVRYAFQSSLDLAEPIAPGLYSLLASGEKPREMVAKKAADKQAPPLEGIETGQDNRSPEEKALDKSREIASESTPNTSSDSTGEKPGQFQEAFTPNEEGENIEGGEKSEGASRKDSAEGEQSEGKKDAKDFAKKQAPDPKQNNGNQQGDNNSLVDKFKDAMANLMNKMKNQDQNKGQSQQTKDNQQGQKGAGQQKEKAEGQKQGGKEQADAQQPGEQQGQQAGEGNEKTANQQAKAGEQGGNPPPSDAQSGMGKQDGDKSIEIAKQQEAMGKISELFGKRAKDLQGEVMIEVSSSKSQQLKTGYSGKTGAHSDKGGVILRDEVPLELQGYVQKYFEEIRKPSPPAKK
ncbi:MAG: hypothetical protein OHK0021_12230 [Bryobacter sp.]